MKETSIGLLKVQLELALSLGPFNFVILKIQELINKQLYQTIVVLLPATNEVNSQNFTALTCCFHVNPNSFK